MLGLVHQTVPGTTPGAEVPRNRTDSMSRKRQRREGAELGEMCLRNVAWAIMECRFCIAASGLQRVGGLPLTCPAVVCAP